MFDLIAVVSFVAAGLLATSGAVKFVRPLPTSRAMYAAGLPGSDALSRVIGAVELVTGIWFLAAPSLASGLVLAGIYLAFTAFVAFLVVARPAASSCGCAGSKDVPPSWIHAALNLLAAAAALAAALNPPAGLVPTVTGLGIVGVPFVIGVLTAAALTAAAVSDLPTAMTAFHRPSGHPVEPDGDRHVRADAALSSVGIGPGHGSLWPGADPAEIDASPPNPVESPGG
jgi:hypothetical protein